jgi:hypothetical protein
VKEFYKFNAIVGHFKKQIAWVCVPWPRQSVGFVGVVRKKRRSERQGRKWLCLFLFLLRLSHELRYEVYASKEAAAYESKNVWKCLAVNVTVQKQQSQNKQQKDHETCGSSARAATLPFLSFFLSLRCETIKNYFCSRRFSKIRRRLQRKTAATRTTPERRRLLFDQQNILIRSLLKNL